MQTNHDVAALHAGELRCEAAEAKADWPVYTGVEPIPTCLGWRFERIWQGRLMADSVVPSGLGKCDWRWHPILKDWASFEASLRDGEWPANPGIFASEN